MSLPLVSICIPCHNAAPWLEPALESVVQQTYGNIEIIVADNGSTDDSSKILSRFALEHDVLVIKGEYRNPAASRNEAFKKSRGTYVKFFDTNDLLSPMIVEEQVARLKGTSRSIASAEWGRFYENDLASYRANPESVSRDISGPGWLSESFVDARPMMQSGIFLIPRGMIEDHGDWDEKLTHMDDFEFFSRLFSQADEILFTPESALYYRSSLRSKFCRTEIKSAFHALDQGILHLMKVRDSKAARLGCANLMQDFIYTYYPEHPEFLDRATAIVNELGGSKIEPDGPPRFQKLRKYFGWKLARRIERQFTRHRQPV